MSPVTNREVIALEMQDKALRDAVWLAMYLAHHQLGVSQIENRLLEIKRDLVESEKLRRVRL